MNITKASIMIHMVDMVVEVGRTAEGRDIHERVFRLRLRRRHPRDSCPGQCQREVSPQPGSATLGRRWRSKTPQGDIVTHGERLWMNRHCSPCGGSVKLGWKVRCISQGDTQGVHIFNTLLYAVRSRSRSSSSLFAALVFIFLGGLSCSTTVGIRITQSYTTIVHNEFGLQVTRGCHRKAASISSMLMCSTNCCLT